ncbi:hypothetical protein [Streptomyces sp. NPDC058092]|uniref:hypothetical protein n=1 Tax=Streptomyces sp. NPDC058092 TaxID=3346336 RepID=UPI0036F08968
MTDDVRNIVLGVIAAGISAAPGWITRTSVIATTPCACSSGTSTRTTQAPAPPSSARNGVAGRSGC